MSNLRAKAKSRTTAAVNNVSDSSAVISFLKGEAFATLVNNLLKEQLNDFKEKINNLEKEVQSLRQSNAELVKLVASGPSEVTKVDDGTLDYSNDTVKSDDTVIHINVQINKKGDTFRTSNEGFTPAIKKQTKQRQVFQNNHEDLDVVGSSCDESDNDIPFTGASKKMWLYVDRCETGVKPEHVNEYLKRRCPGKNFIVEPVRQNEQRPSFKVGAHPELEPVLRQPSFWPKDILVRRFNFFRNSPKKHRLEPKNIQF